VTERDLVRRVLALNKPSSTKIKEVMSSPIVVINPDESISELAQLMKDRKIHKVAVIRPPDKNESQLVGIVTDTDLICYNCRGSTSKMTDVIDQICLRKSN
jgi:CBS domain-containing protein